MHSTRQRTLFRVALTAAIAVCTYLATTPHVPSLLVHVYDKLQHATAFAVLALLLDFSFPRSGFDVRKVGVLLAYGVGIEVWQMFLPYRSPEILDVVADIVGFSCYALAIPMLRRAPILRQRWTLP